MKPIKKLAMAKLLRYAGAFLYLVGFGALLGEHYILFLVNGLICFVLLVASICFDFGFIFGVINQKKKPVGKILSDLSPIKPIRLPEVGEDKPKTKYLQKPTEFIMHYLTKSNNRERYLCNYASKVTLGKATKTKRMVTCKNCLKIMKRDGIWRR